MPSEENHHYSMNVDDHRSFLALLKATTKGDPNPDLCDAGAVLYQFS